MNPHPRTRMSPLTALFLGISMVLTVTIVSVAGIAIFGLSIVNDKADRVVGLADSTVGDLPELVTSVTGGLSTLVDSLPPALADAVNDHRAPDYAEDLIVTANLKPTGHDGRVRPVVTLTNQGDEMVSLLCLRVAVLDQNGVPRAEWTELLATPLAIDNCWRGPIMPGSTRHVVMQSWRGMDAAFASTLTAVCEIAELRLWNGPVAEGTTVATAN